MSSHSTRWTIAAFGIALLVPSLARAEHRYNAVQLQRATSELHRSMAHFERLICRRPLPRHELHHIHVMTEKVCRLADAVQCRAVWGRVKGDFHVVHAFARTVDRRLGRHFFLRDDLHVQRAWRRVYQDVDRIGCMLLGHQHRHLHQESCPHCASGHASADRHENGHRHTLDGVPVERFLGRPAGELQRPRHREPPAAPRSHTGVTIDRGRAIVGGPYWRFAFCW